METTYKIKEEGLLELPMCMAGLLATIGGVFVTPVSSLTSLVCGVLDGYSGQMEYPREVMQASDPLLAVSTGSWALLGLVTMYDTRQGDYQTKESLNRNAKFCLGASLTGFACPAISYGIGTAIGATSRLFI
ncbi:MAG: hypothetical protein WCI72_06855 [archaeon]